GDALAMAQVIDADTCAILVEPIQGEGGVIIPPEGYLRQLRQLADENNLLLILDEIQMGLGRTGKMFAYQHEDARPDLLILAKALGGGICPISVVLADEEVMGVLKPGDHGSTFGGNPFACAVACEALDVLIEEELPEKAAVLGAYFMEGLKKIKSPAVKEIRGKGLMIGVEIKPEFGDARIYCERLQEKGLLCKDTHYTTIRFAPPLVIAKEEIDWALAQIQAVLN
ncbi:MAG: aminotransferase class III-fold pyridoxal phosphate-dependent enzyme, partial [Clostridiales bacterium]|nr:aminotransferase class III-fold pyridoxal phosphate-dependent enzyme [Clostridiales bacterium]